MDFALRDAVHHHTRVVAHIGGLHLGNVKVSCLLRDEASIVLLNEVRVFVEDPCISEVWKTRRNAYVTAVTHVKLRHSSAEGGERLTS